MRGERTASQEGERRGKSREREGEVRSEAVTSAARAGMFKVGLDHQLHET